MAATRSAPVGPGFPFDPVPAFPEGRGEDFNACSSASSIVGNAYPSGQVHTFAEFRSVLNSMHDRIEFFSSEWSS